MFGDNNTQSQPIQNDAGQVGAPANPVPADGISSFTMDPPPHHVDDIGSGAPAAEDTSATAPPVTTPHSEPSRANDLTPPSNTNNDLADIKQKALSQLAPIVSHLDQEPTEKFKTLMMMIQASDDKSLISEAYETAQNITDDKEKAQALLDVVNEINYFTQKDDDPVHNAQI